MKKRYIIVIACIILSFSGPGTNRTMRVTTKSNIKLLMKNLNKIMKDKYRITIVLFEESDFIIIYAYSLFDPNYDANTAHFIILYHFLVYSTMNNERKL